MFTTQPKVYPFGQPATAHELEASELKLNFNKDKLFDINLSGKITCCPCGQTRTQSGWELTSVNWVHKHQIKEKASQAIGSTKLCGSLCCHVLCVDKMPVAGRGGAVLGGFSLFQTHRSFETEPILNHKSSFIVDINQLMITWPNWQWRVPETGRIKASCTLTCTHAHLHTHTWMHQPEPHKGHPPLS